MSSRFAEIGVLMLLTLIIAPNAFSTEMEPTKASEVKVERDDMKLTRTNDLGQFFDVCGHRTAVLGREGAESEIWIYPFKALYDLRFGFTCNGETVSSEFCRKSFTISPEASFVEYETPDFRVVQTILAPLDESAAVMRFDVRSEHEVQITASFISDLKLMWPADYDRKVKNSQDEQTGQWTITVDDSKHVVIAGWTENQTSAVKDGVISTKCTVSPKEKSQVVTFIVAGSVDGSDDARKVFNKVSIEFDKMLERTADYYRKLDQNSTRIETPDPLLDEAFSWAKVGIDKCFMSSPGMGSGFVAGYAQSGDGGRNGFGWYFGRDSSWTGFAVNAYGDFDKVKQNLDLLVKYQIPDGDDKGKIYHEVSAAHELMPVEDRGYAYPGGDSTAFYVIDVSNYWRWTGDKSLVKRHWPHIVEAMDWCYRMDVDGDGLIDNPPAGHEWYDYGEKNMVDLVAIWKLALDSAADMADFLGDPHAKKWHNDATRVGKILNTDFWDDKRGYIYDRKLPDGKMIELTTANPAAPLLWHQIDADKADRAIDRLAKPDMAVPWGVRTNSSEDSIYNSSGYHEGTVWPFITGWASLAAFANHRPEEGMKWLKANADFTRDFCLGYITEVVYGSERKPSGCPHQAWSEAMIVLPVVEGLFGIRADAPNSSLELSPHLPAGWNKAGINGLRVGGDVFDIEITKTATNVVMSVRPVDGKSSYSVVVSPALPKDAIVSEIRINGAVKATPQVIEGYRDIHVPVTEKIGGGVTVEYALKG
jgi:glycogen debranching enzyme